MPAAQSLFQQLLVGSLGSRANLSRVRAEHATALMLAAQIGDRQEQARAHHGLAWPARRPASTARPGITARRR